MRNEKDTNEKDVCDICYTSTEDCINSRRCFMTGEYCSKQMNIQRERKKLHSDRHINAFVIMNFSNMSDVVYKWRLKRFIESLSKYLYMDSKAQRLYCRSSFKLSQEESEKINENGWKQVEKIHVIRADSDPASNYVICNRVCQQMQIADLIIVDVSIENANVFYEFGMAVALGKLILPICYSESFYRMVIPEGLKQSLQYRAELEHHIDCFPWRRTLFEYYGIRYRSVEDCVFLDRKQEQADRQLENQITAYANYGEARDKQYGFTDMQYDRFPYHVGIGEEEKDEKEGEAENSKETSIGEKIYQRLHDTYNNARYRHNTLVVYTMDGFLNESQAGQCIINFYVNITIQMKEEHCFCGERVGVLIQGDNAITEEIKDAKEEKKLLYRVGEVIHIGMNQATYVAQQEKIKAEDFLTVADCLMNELTEEEKYEDAGIVDWKKEIRIFVKDHIRNKSISIYPDNPVYVNRVKNGLQRDVLEKDESKNNEYKKKCEFSFEYFFCLYHVMLRTLKYTNEVVVDISNNSIQALFWLGAAHGSDVYAITVQHERTDKEREDAKGVAEKKERNIFDIAGLWTGVFRSNDTEGFYRQLELAQLGIEQNIKLKMKNVEYYEEKLRELLYEERQSLQKENKKEDKEFRKLLDEKKDEEIGVLESYYRDRFWKPMLRYNRLWIYLPQVDNKDERNGEPRLHTVKWDVDAIATLSHYLSKRKIIGEYQFKTLGEDVPDDNAGNVNFICVGDAARPLKNEKGKAGSQEQKKTISLAQHISHELQGSERLEGESINIIHERAELPEEGLKRNETDVGWSDNEFACLRGDGGRSYKGFIPLEGADGKHMYTQLPRYSCYDCMHQLSKNESLSEVNNLPADACKIYHSVEEVRREACSLQGENPHYQLAQLIFWREVPKNVENRVYFRIALIGASGPATLALSSILVDNAQKKEIFGIENDKDEWLGWDLLNKLQKKIRSKFTEIYYWRLEKAFGSIDEVFADIGDEKNREEQKKTYFMRVKYAVGMYLSTVLYRYFLPFLSLEEEYRICNGMRTYVSAMMSAGVSPFCLKYPQNGDIRYSTSASEEFVKKAAREVIRVLEATLKSFRGVEAFYQVKVNVLSQKDKASDTRKVMGIQELADGVKESVNCLFCFKENEVK